jgi:multicomponent Na+:H+ antiporter subunit C
MLQYFALALMLVGVYGLLSQRNAIKMIVSLNIFEIGINVFIISVGYVKGGIAPILTSDATSSSLLYVDPLPHALVLTAIVIGVGVTALALALARNMYKKYGTYELDEMGGEA